ncbi:hypothetical protein [Streptomyces sp. URMC 124]|uniref:hypothetical protein n=1 Tax=Streptomyces sp. URMC 124 TaxID=3423405 RepID=UPI003F198990
MPRTPRVRRRGSRAWGAYSREVWRSTPEGSAALFEAAARIPGVALMDGAADATDPAGIAVAHTGPNSHQEWIFGRNTYEYLGRREILVKPYRGLESGALTY